MLTGIRLLSWDTGAAGRDVCGRGREAPRRLEHLYRAGPNSVRRTLALQWNSSGGGVRSVIGYLRIAPGVKGLYQLLVGRAEDDSSASRHRLVGDGYRREASAQAIRPGHVVAV